MKIGSFFCKVFYSCYSANVLPNRFGKFLNVLGNDHGEIDSHGFTLAGKKFNEGGQFFVGADLDDLQKVIDKDVNQVVVLGVAAKQEARKGVEPGQGILAVIDETSVVIDVQGQGVAVFNAQDAAGMFAGGLVYHFDELLGLTGTFFANN